MTRATRAWGFRLAVTLGVLWVLLHDVDEASSAAVLRTLSGAHLLSLLVLTATDRLLAGWRWVLLVRAAGVPLGYREGFRIFLISSFVGSFAPAGIGGDIARFWEVKRHCGRADAAAATALVDRWLGTGAVALTGILGLALWTHDDGLWFAWPFYALAGLMVVGMIAMVTADRLVEQALPEAWRSRRPWSLLHRLAGALALYRERWDILLVVAAASMAVQLVRVMLMAVGGHGLGAAIEWQYYLVFVPVTILAILLPISIGGLGVGQGATVWLLEPVGVDEHVAFAMGTLFVLLGIISNLPGGWLYLLDARQRLTER